jgi:hypothetical protein
MAMAIRCGWIIRVSLETYDRAISGHQWVSIGNLGLMGDCNLMTNHSDFEKIAESESGGSIVSEFWGFLKSNKKWWLGPIVVMMLLLGGLLLLSTTAVAPFIYTLF